MSLEELKKIWKQIEPVVVNLQPGELRRVDNLIVEKTENGKIIVYEIVNDST